MNCYGYPTVTLEGDNALLNWTGYCLPVPNIAPRLYRSGRAVRYRLRALGLSDPAVSMSSKIIVVTFRNLFSGLFRGFSDIPATFSWTGPMCGTVNHADEIEIIRHGREMAANGVRSKEECGSDMNTRMQSQHLVLTMAFLRNANNSLQAVSQSSNSPEMRQLLVQDLIEIKKNRQLDILLQHRC